MIKSASTVECLCDTTARGEKYHNTHQGAAPAFQRPATQNKAFFHMLFFSSIMRSVRPYYTVIDYDDNRGSCYKRVAVRSVYVIHTLAESRAEEPLLKKYHGNTMAYHGVLWYYHGMWIYYHGTTIYTMVNHGKTL